MDINLTKSYFKRFLTLICYHHFTNQNKGEQMLVKVKNANKDFAKEIKKAAKKDYPKAKVKIKAKKDKK